jgi:hypothetical protein
MKRSVLAVVLAIIALVGSLCSGSITRWLFPPNIPPQVPAAMSSQSSGAARLADGSLICWGQADLEGQTHTRSFSFKFKEPFGAKPVITYGIHPVGSGYSFALYNNVTTESSYSGSIVEVSSRKTGIPVSFSYTAIGLPASR